jgi:hypothetical protein
MQPPTRAGSAPAKTSKIKAKLPIVLVVLGIALTPIWITALGWFPLRLFVSAIESLRLLTMG